MIFINKRCLLRCFGQQSFALLCWLYFWRGIELQLITKTCPSGPNQPYFWYLVLGDCKTINHRKWQEIYYHRWMSTQSSIQYYITRPNSKSHSPCQADPPLSCVIIKACCSPKIIYVSLKLRRAWNTAAETALCSSLAARRLPVLWECSPNRLIIVDSLFEKYFIFFAANKVRCSKDWKKEKDINQVWQTMWRPLPFRNLRFLPPAAYQKNLCFGTNPFPNFPPKLPPKSPKILWESRKNLEFPVFTLLYRRSVFACFLLFLGVFLLVGLHAWPFDATG